MSSFSLIKLLLFVFIFLCLALIVFGLPGIWIMIGVIYLFDLISKSIFLSWKIYLIFLAIAFFSEILEWYAQLITAKAYGISKAGLFSSFLGSIVLAILLSPLFFGIGAVIGSFIGAFFGAFLGEFFLGRSKKLSLKASFGALLGRFLGFSTKFASGIAIIILVWKRV